MADTGGLDGRSGKMVSTYREVTDSLLALIGSAGLQDLTAPQVRPTLVKLSADRSTRTLQITRNVFVRVIRLAEANDLVGCNVTARPARLLVRPVARPHTMSGSGRVDRVR
jgi:hypothetical protein